jgi:phosphoglycerate dehydrogenase-like enzyme
MTIPLVLLTHTLPENWLNSLKGRVNLLTGPEDATTLSVDLEEHLDEAEGLFCLLTIPVDEILLERAPRLRVVSNMAVGVDNIDVATCTRRGIPVGNTPGVLTEATADLTMSLMLSIARHIPQAADDARKGRWTTWRPAGWLGVDLSGSTLGIIGMGKIGQAVARRAKGFGMRIIYADELDRPEIEATFAAIKLPLEAVLRQSDILSLHVPLTPTTRHLINDEALHLMKPSAILINAARGAIVDTLALVHALTHGTIAAAALDVTDPEPLPPDHPLYTLPNCLIVPHIGSATENTRRRMAEMACENLLAGLEGRHLPNCVNPEVYK